MAAIKQQSRLETLAAQGRVFGEAIDRARKNYGPNVGELVAELMIQALVHLRFQASQMGPLGQRDIQHLIDSTIESSGVRVTETMGREHYTFD